MTLADSIPSRNGEVKGGEESSVRSDRYSRLASVPNKSGETGRLISNVRILRRCLKSVNDSVRGLPRRIRHRSVGAISATKYERYDAKNCGSDVAWECNSTYSSDGEDTRNAADKPVLGGLRLSGMQRRRSAGKSGEDECDNRTCAIRR